MDAFEQRAALAEKALTELTAKVADLEGIIQQRSNEASDGASAEEVVRLRQERDQYAAQLKEVQERLAKKEYQVKTLIRSLEEEERKGGAENVSVAALCASQGGTTTSLATGPVVFSTDLPLEELNARVNTEFLSFARVFNADAEYPTLRLNDGHLERGDFTANLRGTCARLRIKDAVKFVEDLAAFINGKITDCCLLKEVSTDGAFVHLKIRRTGIFRAAIARALDMGDAYGTSKTQAGKRVIIEHTSSNPNGPLHIGNLRNSILGAHLAELFKAVGYEVRQHFFVNDLGAQIGLTAYGYVRLGHIQPKLKNDQWIGLIYAIMNTFNEFQKLGISLPEVYDRLQAGTLQELVEGPKSKEIADYVDVTQDLNQRQPELMDELFKACKDVPDIRAEAGRLNLDYENNEAEAVKIFRKMVVDCLVGVQQTLDTYNIRHDQFDFESELGWEGSNDLVLDRLRSCPYYVPQTQSNAEGKPEGGHFLMAKFIESAGLPTGKKGYQKNYPNFYLVRPDGSTLYTCRDVVYTLKKTKQADLVFNIIASEQNLPQEKVALAVRMLKPEDEQKQYHLSYELVTLETKDEDTNDVKKLKMSGRRGRYVLADDLFVELKQALHEIMQEKYKGKEQENDEEFFQQVTEELATATMKYVLLQTGTKHKIKINVAEVVRPENSSTGSFCLYNFARTSSLFRKHEQGIAEGKYPPLPPRDQIQWELLDDPSEWELLTSLITFPSLILATACPNLPSPPDLVEFQTQKLVEFLSRVVQVYSKYYKRVRVLTTDEASWPAMHARLYFAKAIQGMMGSAIRILTMQPLKRI